MTPFRDYSGPQDLRAMQSLTQRIWSLPSPFHIGNLAWERFEHLGREPEWPTRLWLEGDAVRAWGWIQDGGHLYFQVDPARADLFDTVLAWFEATATGETLTTVALDNDADGLARLAARGYRALGDGHPFALRMCPGPSTTCHRWSCPRASGPYPWRRSAIRSAGRWPTATPGAGSPAARPTRPAAPA